MELARLAETACRCLPAPAASCRAPSPFLPKSPFVPAAASTACRALAAALRVCANTAQPPMRVAALRCEMALSTFCEYSAEEPNALASPRPRPLRKYPSFLGTNPELVAEMTLAGRNQSRSYHGRSRVSPK